MIILYLLLSVSVFIPIYTYALYPLVLRLLPQKNRRASVNFNPTVSVVIIGNEKQRLINKVKNINQSNYNNIAEILNITNHIDFSNIIPTLKGDVIVMTDLKSTFCGNTISEVVCPLSDYTVGCVCGMIRKQPDENGEYKDGANWKYENKIKFLESNIGCLSGANTAIYAFKRKYISKVFNKNINLDFFIPTSITEKGFDVLFRSSAVAYEDEEYSEKDLFVKHIHDGASGYNSIVRFWRLLLPRKGSFVFWSHRVMKWLVPFNMLILLIGCAILSASFLWAKIILIMQILAYTYLILYYYFYSSKRKELPGLIGKFSGFASYFLVLNIAWFLGLFYSFKR